MDTKIIGRSSGRSVTGAAAYRSGEKLRSVAHASYQSGEKIQGNKITHDYTKKKGVVHSEIILPEGASPEYADSQTLERRRIKRKTQRCTTRKTAYLLRQQQVKLSRLGIGNHLLKS
ncbi:MAG: MobA/MobL family protein [Nitrososphaerota archaeon]|nr:MobA/MobL family protein [Nitrososphaerota archaeon]